jgi:hypothetical protein
LNWSISSLEEAAGTGVEGNGEKGGSAARTVSKETETAATGEAVAANA